MVPFDSEMELSIGLIIIKPNTNILIIEIMVMSPALTPDSYSLKYSRNIFCAKIVNTIGINNMMYFKNALLDSNLHLSFSIKMFIDSLSNPSFFTKSRRVCLPSLILLIYVNSLSVIFLLILFTSPRLLIMLYCFLLRVKTCYL